MEKHTFKLCEAKGGVKRSRVWLERARLTRAGFTVGKKFSKTWGKDKLVLEVVSASEAAKLARSEFGTVCGKPDRPVIDIVGAKVFETFGSRPEIDVTFDDGRITIRSA
jgi:hypothetical protein